MPQPAVAGEETDDSPETPDAPAEGEQPETPPEPDSVEELGEQASTDTPAVDEQLADPVPSGSDSFFAGEETLDDEMGVTDDEEFDGMAPDEPEEEPHSFEEPIVEGVARLAVVGIEDDSEADDLQSEFEDVFEAFQLGHYGNRVMHEYVLQSGDDINPVFGLAASSMACTALVLYMRPDGDEVVAQLNDRLSEVADR